MSERGRSTEGQNKMTDTLKSSLINWPHGFSTRRGGVSEGIFSSLNLGMSRGDDPEKVKENYRIFLTSCGIEKETFVCGKQVHGDRVMVVGKEHARAPYGYEELFEADGYVTAERGVPLVVFTADCIPLLMADEKNGVAAAVHSGWRSTVLDIEKNAVEAMCLLGAERSKIAACIGPAIGKCCFEVGGEVIDAVKDLLGRETEGLYRRSAAHTGMPDEPESARYMLDLKEVLRRCLIRSGVAQERIEIIGDCTMCMPEKYWSHRYTGGKRGSQASVIMIPEN